MDPVAWLVVALLAAIVALAIAWRRAADRTGRGNRRRQRLALRAETEAERLLEQHGFAITDRQPTATWNLYVDGVAHEVRCRGDLVATRGGQTWLVEVKSTARAADPKLPATRRQLLEYRLAFDVDGLLLVDMAARRIHRVELPG